MGIRSGKKGIKPHKTPPKVPIQPTPRSPFPDKTEFRLGLYRIIEERNDYLICKGFDPNAKYPFTKITPSGLAAIKVAKPPALQRTIWENGPVVVDGVTYTYVYTAMGVRTATWTDGDGAHEEEQTIEPPYGVTIDGENELLVAVAVRRSLVVDGSPLKDEDGGRITWVDLNVSGRHWKGPGGGGTCTEVHEILIEGQCTGGTVSVSVTINAVTSVITWAYNASMATVQTALEGHSEIAASGVDITVSGGPGPDVGWYVIFLPSGSIGGTQSLPVPDSSSLVGPNPVIKVRKVTSYGWA